MPKIEKPLVILRDDDDIGGFKPSFYDSKGKAMYSFKDMVAHFKLTPDEFLKIIDKAVSKSASRKKV